jgi:hypothetical protein
MALSGKVLFALAALVCLIAVGSFAWLDHSRTAEELDQAAAAAKARQNRDTKSAEKLIELKNVAMADLENAQFASADPMFLELATAGMREPLDRDWTIERLMAIGTLDLKRDPGAYDEAVERAQTALNLEKAVESKSPMYYYLAGRLASARGSAKQRVFEQHLAAASAPRDPVQWCELYQAQQSAGSAANLAESEAALKYLQGLVPDNLDVQLEWVGVQARRKDVEIVDTLSRLRDLLVPLLADQGGDAATRLGRAVQDTQSAAKAANWSAVKSKVETIVGTARNLPEVNADRRRLERGVSWHIVTDYSHAFYQKHHIDRSLPAAKKPVQFRELDLAGPAAKVTDAQQARFVDFDLDGRLDIAVLRSESLEIFARDKSGQWVSVAAAPLPRGAYNHFLAVVLGGAQPPASGSRNDAKLSDTPADFVLFGPAGLLVIENRVEPSGSRTLHALQSPQLAESTKGALSVAAIDLNEDGLTDLVVACRAQSGDAATLRVLRNEGGGRVRDITARSGLSNVSVGGGSLVAVDWDNDLDVDLLAPGVAASKPSTTSIAFCKGRGLARFRPQRFSAKDSDVQSATTLAVLDADSNGSWDLLAGGPRGMFLLFTSTLEHSRVETLGVEAISDFAAEGLLVFDYDNDGCPDLLAWNRDAVRCFHGSAEGHFESTADVLPAGLGAISSADFGDFDQDGDSDLLVVKSGPQTNAGRVALLQNEGGNTNNWIDVRLDARPADAKAPSLNRIPPFGLGSTLCLKTRGVSQMQIVQKPVTHFGIGSLDSADVLRILWNTGVPVNVLNPAKRTTVIQAPPAHGAP